MHDENTKLQQAEAAPPTKNGRLVVKPTATPANTPHPIADVAEKYINSLRNIGQTVQIVMPHVSKWLDDEFKKQEAILSQYFPKDHKINVPHKVTLRGAREYVEFSTAVKSLEALHENRALSVVARSLFMQMFCEFDAFSGALLKAIYTKNDSLLNGLKRDLTYKELVDFKSIDAIKVAILEKEIETFRRDSYVDQFGHLEGKFSIPLKTFDEWPEFVELGQRRNLFVHNDGRVSEQYLSVCEREGVRFASRPVVGEALQVDIKYFGRALRLLTKVGFMLSHTLWFKVFPKEQEMLHASINHTLFTALEQKRWSTAKELGQFALTGPMRKHVSEINLRIRAVNTAIGLKFSGEEQQAKNLLDSFDWTASYRDFKLALSVLSDDFPAACELMLVIGKSGEIIEQSSYHTWPLFHKFREQPAFYETYARVYGEPYAEKVKQDGEVTNVSVGEGNANATASQDPMVIDNTVSIKRRRKAKPATNEGGNSTVATKTPDA